MRYLDLKDIDCYCRSLELSNHIWDIVFNWDWFARRTVGVQYITAADSISANIAEGFGRYTKKDKIKFYRYSFGSLKETVNWTVKSKRRGLITEKQYTHIVKELDLLPKEINQLIKYTNLRLSK